MRKEGELRKQLEGPQAVAGGRVARARKDAHEDERELFSSAELKDDDDGSCRAGNRTSENTLAAQIERERDGERICSPLSLSLSQS